MKTYRKIRDFGKAIGLSALDMAMIDQKKALIAKLKGVRLRKKLSQVAVAKLLGSKQPAVARMEAGQVSQVSMDFLFRAALVLGVRVVIDPSRAAA